MSVQHLLNLHETPVGKINKCNCYNYFVSFIFLQNVLRILEGLKVVLTKPTFWRTPKCCVFPIFPEISRLDVGFTYSDSVTEWMPDTPLD